MVRNNGGNRVFPDPEIAATRIIEFLKFIGLSIKDIKQFMEWGEEGDVTLQKRRDLHYERLDAVKQQLVRVQQVIRLLGRNILHVTREPSLCHTTKGLEPLTYGIQYRCLIALKPFHYILVLPVNIQNRPYAVGKSDWMT